MNVSPPSSRISKQPLLGYFQKENKGKSQMIIYADDALIH